LVRLVVHLIGDGYVPKLQGAARTPAYTNGNEFLRAQFLELLGNVFGDVSECSRSYVDKSGNSRSYIAFSKWVGYVIRHWYPDAEFDELSGRLPEAFFGLPVASKAEVVRAFGDDDGHVGAHSIRFTSDGLTILEQVRRLIVQLMESTLPAEEYKGLLGSVGGGEGVSELVHFRCVSAGVWVVCGAGGVFASGAGGTVGVSASL
jgi:hypothetical protein